MRQVLSFSRLVATGVAAALSLFVCPAFSQEENGTLCFSGRAIVSKESSGLVTVLVTTNFGVEGIQFAVCHDTTQLSVANADVLDTDIAKIKEGRGPDFLKSYVDADQVRVFIIVDYPSPSSAIIPAGRHTLANIQYRMAPGAKAGTTTLKFCSDTVVPALADKDGNEVFPQSCEGTVILLDGDPPDEPSFRRGEFNQDGTLDLTDMVATLHHLFMGIPGKCEKAGDTNDDGILDVTDVIYLGSHLFRGGDAVPEPYSQCGTDPTQDGLTCQEFAPCTK